MKTYKVRFDEDSFEMRKRILESIEGVSIIDIVEDDTIIITVEPTAIPAVEYELRKAERRDGWCDYKII